MDKLKVQITRCYLVQVVDENGYEVAYDWCFCKREDALLTGQNLIKDIKKQEEENNICH